jgi:hypothetical protein
LYEGKVRRPVSALRGLDTKKDKVRATNGLGGTQDKRQATMFEAFSDETLQAVLVYWYLAELELLDLFRINVCTHDIVAEVV